MKGMKKIPLGIGLAILLILVGIVIYIVAIGNRKTEAAKEEILTSYQYHYAFISDPDDQGQMWEDAYAGAKAYGQEHGVYVEWFGKDLVEEYSKTELLRMAIAAKVDGIIVQGDDSGDTNDLVNLANENEIPVIAMWVDCYGSYRTSFVGMSSYNLGQKYGDFLIEDMGEGQEEVLAIINSGSNERLMFTGMRETLYNITGGQAYQVDTIVVNGDGTADIEEKLRELLLSTEDLPNVIVCFDEKTTEVLCNLMVDYNRVGDAKVLGFYSSSSILREIKNGVLYASFTVDANNMGSICTQSLIDYKETGFVSESIPIEASTITAENVEDWDNE